MKNKADKKMLKSLVIGMVVLDVVALFNLILQLYLNDVFYQSYIVLLISNIVVFVTYKINK